MKYALRSVFGTKRGMLLHLTYLFAAFGVCSAVGQIVLALWPGIARGIQWQVIILVILVSFSYGLMRSWPSAEISRHFKNMNVTVKVLIGDLFQQETHLVIGFTDTFDTDMSDYTVISKSSVQGQFQERYYPHDIDRLDSDLDRLLQNSRIENTETIASKPRGKLSRYPIGEVVALGDAGKRFFCLAYGRMSNDLVVESSVSYLWKSLDSLWESVRTYSHLQPVSIPIIGSDLARITSLDVEGLLKMIVLSFVAQSRTRLICRELKVVVHPKDVGRLNMLEVSAFLRAL